VPAWSASIIAIQIAVPPTNAIATMKTRHSRIPVEFEECASSIFIMEYLAFDIGEFNKDIAVEFMHEVMLPMLRADMIEAPIPLDGAGSI